MPIGADLFLDATARPEEVKAHLLQTMPFEDRPDFEENKCLRSEATFVQIGNRPLDWNRLSDCPPRSMMGGLRP